MRHINADAVGFVQPLQKPDVSGDKNIERRKTRSNNNHKGVQNMQTQPSESTPLYSAPVPPAGGSEAHQHNEAEQPSEQEDALKQQP